MKSRRGMASTQRPSQAEQVAPNAWLWADGGFIFADAPNAVTSAAVIVHQISMHRNITPRRVTRSSRVSSRASVGFTTIAQRNPLPARSFLLLTRIRWINRHRDRPERCLQTGKRCFTNRARVPPPGLKERRHNHAWCYEKMIDAYRSGVPGNGKLFPTAPRFLQRSNGCSKNLAACSGFEINT